VKNIFYPNPTLLKVLSYEKAHGFGYLAHDTTGTMN